MKQSLLSIDRFLKFKNIIPFNLKDSSKKLPLRLLNTHAAL